MISSSSSNFKQKNTKIVLYVPDTFDPSLHLPPELQGHADYARYLLHRINVGRIHLRRGNCFVTLKKDYLIEFIPRAIFLDIRDALEDSGIIEVHKSYTVGKKSYGYRLLAPHNEGFTHYRPTTQKLITKINEWRKKESDALRHPVHRELRRFVKKLTIDEASAIESVKGNKFQQSSQIESIRRIVGGDINASSDGYGRFHTNVSNLKSSLRSHLRYYDSKLCNLDVANSQPMILCLLLVSYFRNQGKLSDLMDQIVSETNNSSNSDYEIVIKENHWEDYFSSLSSLSFSPQKEEREGGEGAILPIRRENDKNPHYKPLEDNSLGQVDFSYLDTILPPDLKEFISLCEDGNLYDNLMKRLDIEPNRRASFKKLFFTQVLFGRSNNQGKLRDLFVKDFPKVLEAIVELKKKDYKQLAYLLQRHEGKIMYDFICRQILDTLPGTFVATIHDSVLTTPDKAEQVRTIMMEEFARFGLKPTIRLETY